MDVKYGLLLKKSWNDLKNNLVIFLPILVGFLLFLGFAIVVGLEIALAYLFGFSLSNIKAEIIKFLAFLIPLGIINFILLMFIGSASKAMYAGLLNKITNKGKANSSDLWEGIRKFTWLYFRTDWLLFFVYLLPALAVALLVGIAFFISKVFGVVLLILLGGILVLYLIAVSVITMFGLLFLAPVISTGKTNSAIEVIKQSLNYAKTNLGHVVLTWLILFLIALPFQILGFVMRIPLQFGLIGGLVWAIPFVIGLVLIYTFSIILGTYLQIFTFNAYFNTNLKKL